MPLPNEYILGHHRAVVTEVSNASLLPKISLATTSPQLDRIGRERRPRGQPLAPQSVSVAPQMTCIFGLTVTFSMMPGIHVVALNTFSEPERIGLFAP